MERFIITLDESGTLHVPDVSSTFIWMDEPELVKLFGVIAPTLRAAVRAVYKAASYPPTRQNGTSTCPMGTDRKYMASPWLLPLLSGSILMGHGVYGNT